MLFYVSLGRVRAERIVYGADGLADGGEMRVRLTLTLSRMLPFTWVCLEEEIVRAADAGEPAGAKAAMADAKVVKGAARDAKAVKNEQDAKDRKDSTVVQASDDAKDPKGPANASGSQRTERGKQPAKRGVQVVRALLPGFNRRLVLEYTVEGLQRGELAFNRVALTCGDMLGLTVRTVRVDCPGRAVVKPAPPAGERLGPLPGFEPEQARQGLQPVSAFGGQMAAAASRLRRDGAGPELRAYAPGDSLRRVDWRAMARGLGMQTRMSEAEEAGAIIVLLDASASAYGKARRLFDANAGRAAAILREAAREGKRVKVLTNAAPDGVIHDGGSGADALREAETRLAGLRLGDAAKPMSQRLSDIVAGAPRGASVICLTAGRTGNAEAIARQSGDPGNISYGAKLAGVRGIRLLLLLSVHEAGGEAAERSWQERLRGTGCGVKALPVPASYANASPRLAEAAASAGKEGGGMHAEPANG
ncbi:DUF58 domain-containing protein [Paenibacillus sp. MWE-103]|uniref:DUF58 domain-containing protein n=1 Tax=Paenibacillus artemisiicola TaxID=1172618 RepID=A0ABS3WL33_9BACL|nr:DUF58 domain-containing protein [Paenibacillus artemisiicola]MBO7749033.1 DUF58 domain-containing protein [Paenibacillus artemisiicola]